MTEDAVSIGIHRNLLIGLLNVSGVSAAGVPGARLALARHLYAGSVVAVRAGDKNLRANGQWETSPLGFLAWNCSHLHGGKEARAGAEAGATLTTRHKETDQERRQETGVGSSN